MVYRLRLKSFFAIVILNFLFILTFAVTEETNAINQRKHGNELKSHTNFLFFFTYLALYVSILRFSNKIMIGNCFEISSILGCLIFQWKIIGSVQMPQKVLKITPYLIKTAPSFMYANFWVAPVIVIDLGRHMF